MKGDTTATRTEQARKTSSQSEMLHRHPQRHTKASCTRHITPTNYRSNEAPSVLKSPDSSEQSYATGSSTAIHTPSARASRGGKRAGKRGGQMNQEATARTTFRAPQSHLTAIPGDRQCWDTQAALDNWTQSPSCHKWGHGSLPHIKQVICLWAIERRALSPQGTYKWAHLKKPAMTVHNFL